MKKLAFLVVALLLAVAMVLPACTPAEVPVIKWRAYTFEVEGEPGHDYLVRVANEIKTRSEGQLVITVYPGGALGYTQDTILPVMQQDAIEIAHLTRPQAGGDAPLSTLCALPFLAPSPEVIPNILEAIRPMWNDVILPQFHGKLMADAGVPPVSLSAPRVVDTVEKWKGLKIRAWNPTLANIIETLGGTPVNLPYAEVYAATATGIVEGHCWSPGGTYDGKLYELLDYYNLWYINFGDDGHIVNKPAFDALSSDLQKIVEEAFDNHKQWLYDNELGAMQEDLDKIRGTKMQLIEVPDAEKAKAAEMLSAVYEDWLAQTGPDGLKWLNVALAAAGKPAYQ